MFDFCLFIKNHISDSLNPCGPFHILGSRKKMMIYWMAVGNKDDIGVFKGFPSSGLENMAKSCVQIEQVFNYCDASFSLGTMK